jgi:hypothetical protein
LERNFVPIDWSQLATKRRFFMDIAENLQAARFCCAISGALQTNGLHLDMRSSARFPLTFGEPAIETQPRETRRI